PDDLGRQPAAADAALRALEDLVAPSRRAGSPARLSQAVDQAVPSLAEEAEKQLAEGALGALVEPRFRLIGAGGAVQTPPHAARPGAARAQAERAAECRRHAEAVRQRMEPVIEQLQKGTFLLWGRRARAAAELVGLFGEYAAAGREAALSQGLGHI